MRAWTISGIWCTLAPSLAAVLVCGCGGPDPSGYRRIDQAQAISTEPPSAKNEVAEPPDSALSTSDALVPGQNREPAVDTGPNVAVEREIPVGTDVELPVSALGPVNVVDGASVAMLLKVVPGDVEVVQDPVDNPVNPASAIAAIPATSNPTAVVASKPRIAELLIPEKSFQRDASSKALRVSYDDLDLLKVLNLEPVTENAAELMPAWLKDLNGQRIRLRGFMYPTFEAEGIERFVLARDNQICCFGRDPKLYDLVQIDMRRGKTTDYIPATRAFDVIGRFKIEMASEDGKPYGLYYIEDAEIIDR